MRRASALVLLSVITCLPTVGSGQEDRFPGFAGTSTRLQREWEQAFRGLPDPQLMRETMQRLTARPHHVGSPYGKANAEWMLARLQEWGLDARIERFDVLFPTPRERLVEMIEPTRFTLKLEEPALDADPTSNQKSEQLPTYNAYSIDGDVTAPLVYVNYGLPDDYEELERLGVSVKGAIAIARYGKSWRGIKPKVAAEHGAVGCIIYSDPRDDGYFGGDVFPAGPMRPKDGVQRGSVMDAPLYPGDPLTPGVGATPGAARLDRKDAATITKIPVLPISYGDAQPLLAALAGPLAPVEWRGALPITYHVGPGPTKVHMRLQFNWDLVPAYNVIARIPGSVHPDEWIIRGNHHDGWVNGADDPVSGAAALLEEARAFATLVKRGWKPARSLVYAIWDGEEPMLLGSTEWAEAHADELRQHAAVYINSDGNGRGFLSMGGSHSLEHFVNDVAKNIDDPDAKMTVWKRKQLQRLSAAPNAEARTELRERGDLRIDALGSGTDYTAFLDHLGIATLDLGFGGVDDGGVYHSIYDDFYWYTHFADTNFAYGVAMAQTIGTTVMRLASADVLPFDFRGTADAVRLYLKELRELLKARQDAIAERNRQIEEGVFRATFDPRRPTVAPATEQVPPHLNFAPLENALDALTESARRYHGAVEKLLGGDGRPTPEAARALDRLLIDSERTLTNAAGLPGRPWFKHLLYAPGVYTGYDVKTIPGVRESIELKRYQQADAEIVRVAEALAAQAALVDRATALAEQGGARGR
jgi:N-acetylated-alpha-linked acidic dipeptidase